MGGWVYETLYQDGRVDEQKFKQMWMKLSG